VGVLLLSCRLLGGAWSFGAHGGEMGRGHIAYSLFEYGISEFCIEISKTPQQNRKLAFMKRYCDAISNIST